MITVNKKELLATLESTVERHLQDVLRDFQNLPASVLLRVANNGGWSIAQCLEHLNRYGNYYLPQIKKRLAAHPGTSSETFTSTWLGNYFTNMMQPGRGKMKTFKAYAPPPILDAHTIVAEFVKQQETLLSCLHLAYDRDLNKIKIPVSIAKFIRLRLGDVFQFVIMHNERHLLQARKNLQ